jgi:hypothetical protein
MASFYGPLFKRSFFALIFISLMHCHPAMCQGTILDSAFTFRAGLVKTGNALNLISRRTGFNFTYDSHLINLENRVSLSFNSTRLSDILDSILVQDSLNYSVIDKYIIISKAKPPTIVRVDSPLPQVTDYISGIIVDEETNEPLSFAAIALKNRARGTVTNASGEFGLRIPKENTSDTLSVSYLGFVQREIPVKQALGNNFTIRMKREFISIPEIIIKTQVPQEIIYKSVAAIPRNYGNTPVMMTGFYREGVMKKQELQVYSEAVLEIYKSSYTSSLLNDQIKIYKSRKVENTTSRDTLSVRLKAGLSTCLELDGIKNLFDFLSREYMAEYLYRISDIVSADDDAVFVIDFEQREGIDLPRYKGSVFINTDDFAVVKADFELHPKYIKQMKDSFITSSSRGISTWPVTVKYSVSYRKLNGRYYLSHVRGDLLFTSKQKKKLFSTQFSVFFELAITGITTTNVSRFDRDEIAPIHSIFSETINDYDADFWGDQDFLKPEDNLIQALKNVKVKLLEFPGDQN